MLLSLVLAAQVVSGDDPPLPPPPGLRLIVSPRTVFHYGEPVRVTVEPERDGFLTVLRVDTDGQMHALFPLRSDDSGFVRAGEALHLRDRMGNESFVSFERDGRGTVLAALSDGPWSYSVMGDRYVGHDHVEALLDLVESMAGDYRYEYEIATYWVSPRQFGVYSSGYGSCYGFRPGYAFGRFYYRFSRPGLFYGYGQHPFYYSASYDRLNPFWLGYDEYDPWCYGRGRYGFWSGGPRIIVIGGPGSFGRPVDRTGLKRKKGDIVKPLEPRRRNPSTDVATNRRPTILPVKERARIVDDRSTWRERAKPRVTRPMPHTPNRDIPPPQPRRRDPSWGGNSGRGAIHRDKPSVERPQPIRPERPRTPPPAIQRPAEKPAEKPKS